MKQGEAADVQRRMVPLRCGQKDHTVEVSTAPLLVGNSNAVSYFVSSAEGRRSQYRFQLALAQVVGRAGNSDTAFCRDKL